MKLILLELNEINFDVIKKYISKGYSLPGFSKILKEGILEILNSKITKGISKISAGNYGGKLGPYLFKLKDLI